MGTQQQCRDNVTMFTGQTIVGYCIITIFDVTTQFRHQKINIFRIFRVVVVICEAKKIVACPTLMSSSRKRSRPDRAQL